MKTAVGLMTTTIITALVATGASAEWRLYVNRDNRAWSLERAYVSNDECDRAARTLYRTGQALGVGCAEYPSAGAAQTPTPRPAEFTRTTSSIERQAAYAYETPRSSTARTPRVTERSTRTVTPRPVPVAERVSDRVAASSSHPAAVIFPPSGGIEIRAEEAPRPTVVAHRPPEPRRQAAPAIARRPIEDDKSSAAVSLARAATEAPATPAKETEAEAAKREAAATADKAERRTLVAVFGGVALVILTGVAYSVYRVVRANPLRGLAVGLIDLGLVIAAFAYPVVELWTRLKVADSVVLSWIPGLIAGIVVAGVGVIVLALELTRRPAHAGSINLGTGAPAAPTPPAPVELIKPGETVKTAEPVKPAEPVRLLQPVNFLEPVAPPEAPRPEFPKWAKPPAEAPKPVEAAKPVEPVKPVESVKPVEPEKPVDAPEPMVGGS